MLVLALAWAAACGGGDPSGAGAGGDGGAADPTAPAGSEVDTQDPEPVDLRIALAERLGLGDFPVPIELAPVVPRRYRETRAKALDRLIAKLEGTTSRESWLFAKEYFWRAGEEAVEPIIEAMDLALVAPARRTHLENLIEAMGRMGRPELAPALLRPLGHSELAIRGKAMKALVRSGTPAAVRQAGQLLPSLGARDQISWLEACRAHLGDDAVAMFRHIYDSDSSPPALLEGVLEQAIHMPPEKAAAIFERSWTNAPLDRKLRMAAIRHRGGDLVGTRFLRDVLAAPDPKFVALALEALAGGDLDDVISDVMRMAEHPDALVRAAATAAIATRKDANATAMLQVLTQDPDWAVKVVALQALAARGERTELEQVFARLHTATGSELTVLIKAIGEIGDGGCGPVLLERYRAAPSQGRKFLQALAYTRSADVFPQMRQVFLEEEATVAEQSRGRQLTTVNYVPHLMVNLRGAELGMVGLFRDLPTEDTERRAWLLDALGQIAADREDEVIDELINGELRSVLADREETPGMRLLALKLLSRVLTLDDAMRLRLGLEDETADMAQAISDVLHLYF